MKTHKACGKAGYSPSEAWNQARKFQKGGYEVHAYHCADCGRYHVGYNRIGINRRRAQGQP